MQYENIVQFLFREATLLDHRKYETWLDMLDEDMTYKMPVRVTRDLGESSDVMDDMTFFDENKRSLTTRVKRLRTTSAWAENPPTRIRHFITNILVQQESGVEVEVSSHFLILRSIRDHPEIEQLFGERCDVIRQTNQGLKLLHRNVYPDQTVLSMLNLSIFL